MMGYPKHEYVPSTKKNSCWRCGQPRDAAVHQPPDFVDFRPPEATTGTPPEATSRHVWADGTSLATRPVTEPARPTPAKASANALEGVLGADGGLPGLGTARPNRASEDMLVQGGLPAPGTWVRVTNSGSAYFHRHALVIRVFKSTSGPFEDKWLLKLLIDVPCLFTSEFVAGVITFKPDEVKVVS